MDPLPPRARISKAFRKAYKDAGLTQETLGQRLGIPQGTISKYARGEVAAPLDVLERVDEACGRPKGHVLRLAGYVDDGPVDVLAAIESDPALWDDVDRECMREAYRVFRSRP